MDYVTFDFVLGFLVAIGLMILLWVPFFFFDVRTGQRRRGGRPIASGENPPAPPLDKVHPLG
jgi:hypothetical protein